MLTRTKVRSYSTKLGCPKREGSADKPFGPPDLKKWHARCSELVKKIGGLGEKAKIHEWKDLFEKEAKPEENPEPEVNGGTPSPASVTPAE